MPHSCSFEVLPVEVIYQILDKLPVRTLSVVSRVSRVFYESCQDERLWRKEIIKCQNKSIYYSPPASPSRTPVGTPPAASPVIENLELPAARLCHVSLTWGNSMWVHGGHNTYPDSQTFAEVKSDLWRYKFDDRKWERIYVNGEGMPAKTEHSAVVYQNKMYLFGGYCGDYFTNSLYCYDFETNECSFISTKGDIPTVRSAHIGVVYKDKMYIFGGWNGVLQNNELYSFDFAECKWEKVSSKGPVPSARCSHAAVVSEKHNAMFVFAGYGGGERRYLNDLCQYNFETGTWSILNTTPPSPRSRMRLVEFQNNIYVYGGWNKNEHFNNLFQYDLDRNRWQEIPLGLDSHEGRIGQHSMVVNNNILYIFAGYNSRSRSSTNDLYAYRLSKPEVCITLQPASPTCISQYDDN